MSTAQTVVNIVRLQIHDTVEPYRWTDEELRLYVNEGQKQIVTFVPEACVGDELHAIADTVSRRTIPADGIQFIKVQANVDPSAPTVPRTSVTYAEMDVLDRWDPSWRYFPPSPTPDLTDYYAHYLFDRRDPTAFWLYPRPTPDTAVRILYSRVPASVVTLAGELSLQEHYDPALAEYVIHRALGREGRYSDPEAANMHFEKFATMMGAKLTNYQRLPTPTPPTAD